MMAYVGDTRSRKLLAKLERHGIGQMIIRGRLAGRRLDRWAYDNGAFEDWRANERPFNGAQFRADVATFADGPRPDFIVLPDLAVQDGMVPGDVPWADIGGVFIGGTLDWKAATACEWVTASHARGKPCHYARCGTAKRVAHAKAIGADSLDSCLPLWSREKCATFLGALAQAPMFLEGSL
jgi:hypothetical protein